MLLADIEVVNSLRRAFSGPPPDAAACKALVATAAALDARSDELEGARNKRLLSAIGQLAQQLAAVAQTAADALDVRGETGQNDAMLDYIDAACYAAHACAAAAVADEWGQWRAARNDVFRILAAAKVVLLAGRQSLVVQIWQVLEHRLTGGSDDAPAAVQLHARLMETAAVQLNVMMASMGQLAAARASGQLAATFASAVAPPPLLLQWLSNMKQVLFMASERGVAGRDWVREFVLPYSGLLATTVQDEAYARHQAELATPYNFMLRRTLVDAVLLCLPPLADAIERQFGATQHDSSGSGSGSGGSVGGGGARSASRRSQESSEAGGGGGSGGEAGEQAGRMISALTMLFNAVDADIMQQGFAEASDRPSNLLGGLRAGVRIALVLPLQPPAGVPHGILSMAHLAAAHFISDTADSLLQRPRVAEVWEQRNDGGSSEQPLPGEAEAEAEEAASLVLQVLPRLAVVLPHLAASEPDNSILSCLVGRYAAPMQLPHLLGEFRTADQVAQWAAAAEAALRLLPLLASRIAQAEPDGGQAAGQQQAAGEEEADSDQSVTEDLVSYLVRHVWHGGAKRLARWAQQGGEDAGDDEAAEEQQAGHGSSEGEQQAGRGSSGGSQLQEGEQQQDERISEGSQPQGSGSIDSPVRQHLPPPELTAQLCQLHSTACRLLALGAAAPVAQQQWWLETSIKLAASLRLVLHTLRVLLVQRGDQELLSERRYAAAYNAHLESLLPLLAATAALPAGDVLHTSAHLLLVDVVGVAPPPAACLLDSDEWMARLRQAVAPVAADTNVPPKSRLLTINHALLSLIVKPRLLARSVASGVLSAGCQQFVQLGRTCSEARGMAQGAVCLLLGVQGQLLEEARGATAGSVSPAADTPGCDGTLQQRASAGGQEWAAAVAALEQSYNELLAVFRGDGADQPDLPTLAAMHGPAVAAAEQVAALLLQAWSSPEQQAARQLELAQAAATRSCAYLRCANVGCEGGPFAGQGADSKRCSACRAVWYCGTDCSHADWRAGHKRVCKALAAARQAEKEAARQAKEATQEH